MERPGPGPGRGDTPGDDGAAGAEGSRGAGGGGVRPDSAAAAPAPRLRLPQGRGSGTARRGTPGAVVRHRARPGTGHRRRGPGITGARASPRAQRGAGAGCCSRRGGQGLGGGGGLVAGALPVGGTGGTVTPGSRRALVPRPTAVERRWLRHRAEPGTGSPRRAARASNGARARAGRDGGRWPWRCSHAGPGSPQGTPGPVSHRRPSRRVGPQSHGAGCARDAPTPAPQCRRGSPGMSCAAMAAPSRRARGDAAGDGSPRRAARACRCGRSTWGLSSRGLASAGEGLPGPGDAMPRHGPAGVDVPCTGRGVPTSGSSCAGSATQFESSKSTRHQYFRDAVQDEDAGAGEGGAGAVGGAAGGTALCTCSCRCYFELFRLVRAEQAGDPRGWATLPALLRVPVSRAPRPHRAPPLGATNPQRVSGRFPSPRAGTGAAAR
ncbi:uncharacterized protein LOC142407509 [Mycteria americana]|uniref:uncharacterized protein LOC142407509 n=1 Tax=Mycteria americana TaxID=33587 RepID=UPI003F58952B